MKKIRSVLAVVQGEEGTVTLGFTVEADGSVANVHLVNPSGFPRLDELAKGHVTNWRYNPARKDGTPIACLWKASVAWSLRNGSSAFQDRGNYAVVGLGPSDYPPDALARKETGAGEFGVVIAGNGKIAQNTVIRSTGFADLDSASIAYTRDRFKLTPAEFEGKPITSLTSLVVVWSPVEPPKKP